MQRSGVTCAENNWTTEMFCKTKKSKSWLLTNSSCSAGIWGETPHILRPSERRRLEVQGWCVERADRHHEAREQWYGFQREPYKSECLQKKLLKLCVKNQRSWRRTFQRDKNWRTRRTWSKHRTKLSARKRALPQSSWAGRMSAFMKRSRQAARNRKWATTWSRKSRLS